MFVELQALQGLCYIVYHIRQKINLLCLCLCLCLIRQTQHFYLLDHWFSGHRLSSLYNPPLCQHATLIYCAKYVNTYTGKSFCWHKGGGTTCHKTFPNFYMFHCKKHSFCPKLSPCSIPKGKLIPLS